MSEKIYNTMGNTGVANLVLGIIVIVTGLTAGIMMLVHGTILLKNKKNILI